MLLLLSMNWMNSACTALCSIFESTGSTEIGKKLLLMEPLVYGRDFRVSFGTVSDVNNKLSGV